MVTTEVSDISANVGVRLRAVKTLLTKIHVSLARFKVSTKLRIISMVLWLLIPRQACWSSETAAPRCTLSNEGSYHSRRMSLILLHTFAKCSIALSIPTSRESREAYSNGIQLVAVIVLHPHKSLRCPLSDLWLTLFVRFVPHMNRAFSLHSDDATSWWDTTSRASTHKWDMTAEHTFSYLCDEHKRSVDESGRLVNPNRIVS